MKAPKFVWAIPYAAGEGRQTLSDHFFTDVDAAIDAVKARYVDDDGWTIEVDERCAVMTRGDEEVIILHMRLVAADDIPHMLRENQPFIEEQTE